MKYIIILLIFFNISLNAQQIVMSNGYDTVSVSMIPEKVDNQLSYDMCFDLVYQYDVQGYLIEQDDDYFGNAYTAYYYIRQGFGYEWVQDNIQFNLNFQFTLISTEEYMYSD